MNKDKSLEELFLAVKATPLESDGFMASLNRKLDAVEYIKQHEEACQRRYRYVVIVTFILGIVCGGIMMAVIMSMPGDVPLFVFGVQNNVLITIEQNSHFIASIVLAAIICFAVVNVISNIYDMMRMKDSVRERCLFL